MRALLGHDLPQLDPSAVDRPPQAAAIASMEKTIAYHSELCVDVLSSCDSYSKKLSLILLSEYYYVATAIFDFVMYSFTSATKVKCRHQSYSIVVRQLHFPSASCYKE